MGIRFTLALTAVAAALAYGCSQLPAAQDKQAAIAAANPLARKQGEWITWGGRSGQFALFAA
jgi:hypothetical protein